MFRTLSLLFILALALGCKKTKLSAEAKMGGMRTWSGTEEKNEYRPDSGAYYIFDTSFSLNLSFPIEVLNSTTIVLHDASFFGPEGDTVKGSTTNSTNSMTFTKWYANFYGSGYITVIDSVNFDYLNHSVFWQYSIYGGLAISFKRTLYSAK